MRYTQIHYEGRSLGDRFLRCTNMFTRLRGLLCRKDLSGIDGAYISPCNAVHTFMMAFPIDVVFIDASGKVVAVVERMMPGKATSIQKGAKSVIELEAGRALTEGIKPGGCFTIRKVV